MTHDILERLTSIRPSVTFDFRATAFPDDPLRYLFEEWVEPYRTKFALARAIAPRSILEIGVRYGYSAHAFLSACPQARYVGIDNDSSTFGGSHGALQWARRITADFAAEFLVADTQTLATLPGDAYDLVHVDGQQDGDGTFRDLELALEKATWILVDGYFWSMENMQAAAQFLHKYRDLVEFAVVIPGYAGELLVKVAAPGTFRRPGSAPLDAKTRHHVYTADYYLHVSPGHQLFKSSNGRALDPVRFGAAFDIGAPWEGKRVLDVGCGRGELAYACAMAGATVVGIDVSPVAIELAERTYRDAAGDRLRFVRDDILAFTPEIAFDRILAIDVLQHVEPRHQDRLVDRLSSWLAPEGKLVLRTQPNHIALEHRQRERRVQARRAGLYLPRNPRSHADDVAHVNEQTPARLARALRRRLGRVAVWCATPEDPFANLTRPWSRDVLRTCDSIHAVATNERRDAVGFRAELAQGALEADALAGLVLRCVEAPATVHAGATFDVKVEVVNGSQARLTSRPPHPVHLSSHWRRGDDVVLFDGLRSRLVQPLEPGERRVIRQQVLAPAVAGTYALQLTLVQEGVSWFESRLPGFGQTVSLVVR